jgi:hypothetical protein
MAGARVTEVVPVTGVLAETEPAGAAVFVVTDTPTGPAEAAPLGGTVDTVPDTGPACAEPVASTEPDGAAGAVAAVVDADAVTAAGDDVVDAAAEEDVPATDA